MSTKILLQSSLPITDRYHFRSQSNDTRLSSKNKSDRTSPTQRKRYKFSPTYTEQYDNIYKFPTNQYGKRSHSSDSNRYYFPSENLTQYPQQTLTYLRSGSGLDQRSITFIDGSSSYTSDTPYLFSRTTKSQRYPTTTSTYIHSDDVYTFGYRQPKRILDRSLSPEYRRSTRTDTITSTNGSLSMIKRSSTDKSLSVRFQSSSLTTTGDSTLNQARKRLPRKRDYYSIESLDKSVDRLVSSVNKKYGQQQTITPSTSSSLDYISQYYAKGDEPSIESDYEQQKFYYNLSTNRTHTQIMKSVNKSLIDRNYQIDRNRLKHFEQNVRRYLRLFENQSLQRELNYDLIRCFSTSYLHDLRQEEIRQNRIRSHMRSYTYEDIQDIQVPSILEAYKMKTAIDREKHQRLQSSFITEQLSPGSSSGYSPLMVGSLSENMDTQSGGFDTDRKSHTSTSQISTNIRPNVDVFYEIMQERCRGVDASIAGHISRASLFTKSKSRQSYKITRDIDSDVDIKSSSSFWSDEDIGDQYINRNQKRIQQQRKISRYLSTVNRSLLDHPSDLIADFYLSQLNHNMQESVRNIEIISRYKAYKQEFMDDRRTQLGRSLSAEHLYQVRKEHLRYKQPFTKPASFTAEDVADIYKRFVLENYKRKIAIELERRRRARPGYVYTSPIDIHRSFQRPQGQRDYLMVSPPIIVQTKEIIMGRARRTLTNDGTTDIIHHISSVSPPPIFSSSKRSLPTSQTRKRLTTTEPYDKLYITTIPPPDFPDRNQKDENIRTSYRLQAKIYTNIPETKPIQICHANRMDLESESLSFANIESFIPLNQHDISCLTDRSYDEQFKQYTEQKPKQERSTLIIPVDEHRSTIREDISVIEILPTTDLIRPSINKVNEISADSGISLNTSLLNERPTILNLSLRVYDEPLAEYNKTTINNEIPDVDLSDEHVPLASLLEELTTTINKQYATQIIDENYYWKTCEKVEVNARIPIIVYDTEWKDEKVQIISDEFRPNIQNARYKYPENIGYEHVEINRPYNFEIQQIIDNDEQVTLLPDDSYFIRHQQRSNIYIDEPPDLENPLHSTDILTLNYAYHNQKQSNFSSISSTSSFIDMEKFLNQFEESLEHEQHLPLIDQISISYATSIIERNQSKYRSLPIEWYKPTILSHDEQLVEQWTVEKNLDTIQQEGTLHRQQVDFLTNTECDNFIVDTSTNAFCINERSNNSILRENSDVISHCSPASDYETDAVEKDNDTVTSTVIIPLTILPSSSFTYPTLLSQSSPLLTSCTAPIAPIVYFLDVLALEEKEKNNTTKDFLLTIGFGQNKMNEITNTVSTTDQPLRPTWINRSIDNNNIEVLSTSIIHEDETTLSSIQQQIHFAIENQIENDDTALLIYPLYLQCGHDLGANTQALLSTAFETSHVHLPMINEIYVYQMSLHTEFPYFYPPDALPHMLVSKSQEDELISTDDYQINKPEILSFAQTNSLLNNEEQTRPISIKLEQLTYTEHYHIQSLFPFPETCYAEINQPEIITNNNNNNINHFLSNFILTKPIKTEDDDDVLNRFMGENTSNNQMRPKYLELNSFNSTSSVGVRPPTPTEPSPIYEQVKIRKNVDVNMGTSGQYKQEAKYTYGNEKDTTPKPLPYESKKSDTSDDDIFVPEKIIEHISEDEKSTSSEEVMFEEWTEEFNCRRTDEYDGKTNKLIRTTIDETSDRIKSDVLKEEYKEKNTRIKGHKSYDIVKEVYRRAPTHIYEEIPKGTILKGRPTLEGGWRSAKTGQQWSKFEITSGRVGIRARRVRI